MKEATTLAFTGDIGFDHYMQNKWEDENLIDPALLDVLTSSDHVIANVEGPLAGEDAVRVKAAEMRLMHTIDPRAAVVLEKIHADIWNLANNHIMDVGPDGLEMTLEEAKKRGVRTIGAEMDLERAKRPVILDEAGGIGLFGVGYQRGCKPAGPDKAGCLSWSDMDSIRPRQSRLPKLERHGFDPGSHYRDQEKVPLVRRCRPRRRRIHGDSLPLHQGPLPCVP